MLKRHAERVNKEALEARGCNAEISAARGHHARAKPGGSHQRGKALVYVDNSDEEKNY
jgi:hypothetical protein